MAPISINNEYEKSDQNKVVTELLMQPLQILNLVDLVGLVKEFKWR